MPFAPYQSRTTVNKNKIKEGHLVGLGIGCVIFTVIFLIILFLDVVSTPFINKDNREQAATFDFRRAVAGRQNDLMETGGSVAMRFLNDMKALDMNAVWGNDNTRTAHRVLSGTYPGLCKMFSFDAFSDGDSCKDSGWLLKSFVTEFQGIENGTMEIPNPRYEDTGFASRGMFKLALPWLIICQIVAVGSMLADGKYRNFKMAKSLWWCVILTPWFYLPSMVVQAIQYLKLPKAYRDNPFKSEMKELQRKMEMLNSRYDLESWISQDPDLRRVNDFKSYHVPERTRMNNPDKVRALVLYNDIKSQLVEMSKPLVAPPSLKPKIKNQPVDFFAERERLLEIQRTFELARSNAIAALNPASGKIEKAELV